MIEGGKSIYDFAFENLNLNNVYLNVVPIIIKDGLKLTDSSKLEKYNKIKIEEKGEKFVQISLRK